MKYSLFEFIPSKELKNIFILKVLQYPELPHIIKGDFVFIDVNNESKLIFNC